MSNMLFRASKLLTAATFLIKVPATAEPRCLADLNRIETSFCIGNQHRDGDSSLDYKWNLTENTFALTSPLCFTKPGSSAGFKDLLIAVDRSSSLRLPDQQRKKLGSDGVSAATKLITRLRDAVAKAPDQAPPKVALVLFAGARDCREYQTGPISVNGDFPCLFVPAVSLADSAHVDKLLTMLQAAQGQYAIGERSRAGSYGIVSQLLSDERLGLVSSTQTGLVIFGDGRSYTSNAPYPYLRSGAYIAGQAEAKQDFLNAKISNARLVFALSPAPTPLYDTAAFGESYDNMCDPSMTPPGDSLDCKDPVAISDPLTWPINKIDGAMFARELAQIVGGEVVTVMSKEDMDGTVEKLRQDIPLEIDAASYRIDGGEWRLATVSGREFELPELLGSQEFKLDFQFTSDGEAFSIPAQIATIKLAPQGPPYFQDREMLCADILKPTEDTPDFNLNNLQGGSASCGTLGDQARTRSPSKWALFILMFLPVGGAIFLLRGKSNNSLWIVFCALLISAKAAPVAKAAEKTLGLNALQYRPVVDGVGQTETADVLSPGATNAGIFVDYANDAVELGGEKNKRIRSIVDDLITAHAVLNVGLVKYTALGLHIPYVHKSAMDRSVERQVIDAGTIGMPADATIFMKIKALQRTTWAIALMPIATVPTGRPDLLIGDGVVKYGAAAVFSGRLSVWEWSSTFGYLHRDEAQILSDDRAHPVVVRGQGLFSAGVEYGVSNSLALASNIQIKPNAGDGLDAGRASPTEWMILGKLRPISWLELSSGIGTGLGKGYGSPDYRAWIGVAWSPRPIVSRASNSTISQQSGRR